ncbi:MAG: shikimate dehydrogenase [Leptospiraceae bacterium]|nr:shikimate dehydrogenase [Leptospiraceae bacterium]NUM40305.1 shikimate dehydrogenase [Leptospiraceae bacterium]
MKISNKTKIFGILGNPLSHTLSPLIHNYLFQEYGLDGIYLVFETQNPDSTLVSLQNLNVQGLSVTIPYKEWAYSVAHKNDETSEWMKAANTLTFQENKILANNTDGYGAVESIKNSGNKILHSNVVVLGSGGSARGIAYSLAKEMKQKKIYISARNKIKSLELVSLLNSTSPGISEYIPVQQIGEVKDDVSLVINTTPLGMKNYDQDILLSEDFFSNNHTLFDIVYNPCHTPLVKLAMKRKAKIILGYEMLVYQAMKQFEIFTSIQVEKKIIEKVKTQVFKILK